MTRIEVNPALPPAEHIGYLNACFRGGWSAKAYAWHMQRPFAGRAPDTLVAYDGDRPATGVSVNYRQIRLLDGAIQPIAIVTAAWTPREFRGRGYFERLVETAVDLAESADCMALLGFVVASNPSGTTMRRFNAVEFPSHYVFDDGNAPAHRDRASNLKPIELAFDDWPMFGGSRFHYPTPEAWQGQFLDRPDATSVFDVAECTVVVEHTDDTDRLVFLDGEGSSKPAALRGLLSQSRCAQRKFFWYSTDTWAARFAKEHGLTHRRGYVMAVPVRATAAQLLANADTDGTLAVQGGDRM